jgi:hypothetical protein
MTLGKILMCIFEVWHSWVEVKGVAVKTLAETSEVKRPDGRSRRGWYSSIKIN